MKDYKIIDAYKFSFVFGFLLLIASCAPYTKDQYLADYKIFIEEVKSNHNSYSSDAWLKNDSKNSIFYEKDYRKFAGELSPSEYLKVQRYNFVYKYYKGDVDIKSLLGGEYNDLFKGLFSETTEVVKEIGSMIANTSKEDKLSIINKLLN